MLKEFYLAKHDLFFSSMQTVQFELNTYIGLDSNYKSMVFQKE